jgi:CheY-like chemotaxis protein
MRPDVRDRIFEPFFTTKAHGQGSGLGLATVWHTVTECGGHVTVDSAPDQGTAFHLTLPVNPVPTPVAAIPAERSDGKSPPLRIFLAEDEELIAQTLVTVLRRAGHQIDHAPDGSQAWERLQHQLPTYQLLIFDINMPGIDGIELARRVRKSAKFPGRILVISGRLSPAEKDQLSEIGVDAMLNKPFTMEQLHSIVNRLSTPSLPSHSAPPQPAP